MNSKRKSPNEDEKDIKKQTTEPDVIQKQIKLELKEELRLLKIQAEEDKIKFKQFHDKYTQIDLKHVEKEDLLYLNLITKKTYFQARNLLLAGVNPDQVHRGNSLLGVVCEYMLDTEHGHYIAKMLIAFGADIDRALEYVSKTTGYFTDELKKKAHNNLNAITFLLDAGANINGPANNNSILINALRMSTCKTPSINSSFLLSQNVDVGLNPVIIVAATEAYNLELLQKVIPIFKAKNPDQFNKYIVESLYFLFTHDPDNTSDPIIDYLLDLKPNLNIVLKRKWSQSDIDDCLLLACSRTGHIKYIDKLIEFGADVRIKLDQGNFLHACVADDGHYYDFSFNTMRDFITRLPREMLMEKDADGKIPLYVLCSRDTDNKQLDYINLFLNIWGTYSPEYEDCLKNLITNYKYSNYTDLLKYDTYFTKTVYHFFSLGCKPDMNSDFLKADIGKGYHLSLCRLLSYYGYDPPYYAPRKKKRIDDPAMMIIKFNSSICSGLVTEGILFNKFLTKGVYDPRILLIIFSFVLE